MSEKRTKGILRRKFQILVAHKKAIRGKAPRFGKSKIIGSGSTTSSVPPSLALSRAPNGNRQNLLVEMDKIVQEEMPPEWVERYQQCMGLIREIDHLKRTMALEQNRRLSCIKESDEKIIDQKIYSCASEATKKIRKCQSILHVISRQSEHDNQFDKKTCAGICQKLAVEIQQKTREIRAQQRAFIEYRRQIENTTKVSFLELTAEKMLEDPYLDEQIQDEQSLFDAHRNSELLNVVNSIHELNDIFKELSALVVMQGTLLDRIDQNVQISVEKVKSAVQALGKAQEHQKSKLACIIMMVIVAVISILGLVLIIKHR